MQSGKNGKIGTSTGFLDVGTQAMNFRVLGPFLQTARGMRKSSPLSTPHLSARLVKVAQSTIFLDVWDRGDELLRSYVPPFKTAQGLSWGTNPCTRSSLDA